MPSPGYLAQPPAPAGPGSGLTGPATDTLATVAVRIVTVVRSIAVAYVVVQVAIWHEFYAADPRRLAGPLIAVTSAVALVVAVQGDWSRQRLAVADSAVAVGLALCAGECVPPAMRGDTANWLYLAVLVQLVMPALCTSPRLTALLAAVTGLAYWGGDMLTRPAGGTSPAAAVSFLLAVAAILAWGRHALQRRAARADAALARADRDRRDQFVVMSRRAERREHERLLHDTVLNTLTALARGGAGAADAVGRCRHDVSLMEHALSDAGGSSRVAVPLDRLLGDIEAVAGEMRARGLDVLVGTVGPAVPCAGGPSPESPAPVTVAATAASAAVNAVREALANVVSHARTGQAWVEVGTAPGAVPGSPGGLEVTVRDAGVGFDPGRVDPSRLGLRRSVAERVADSGGESAVRSAPGDGTEVRLRWPAPAWSGPAPPVLVPTGAPPSGTPPSGAPPSGAASSGPASSGPAPSGAASAAAAPAGPVSGVVRDTYEAALPRMAAGVAVIWQLTILIQVLAYARDFRQPAIPVAVWLGMLAAAVWLLPRARAGRFGGRESAIAIGVAVTAVALVGWQRRVGASGSIDWSVAGTGWLLALVALVRPAWEWTTGAAAVFAAHAVFALRVFGVTPLGQARLAATGYTVAVVLATFAMLRPAIQAHTRIAARRSALASQAAAERAAGEAIQQDRHERLALLEAEALPLLRAIAEGGLQPGDAGVPDRAARHAATLRRALVDRARRPDGLLADLEPVLGEARDRGLPIEVQVIGDPGPTRRDVASAIRAAVGQVMGVLPPHPVTVTVLAAADEVELYVIFRQPPLTLPDMSRLRPAVPAAAGWRAAVEVGPTGAGCLEVRWRKAALA